MTPLQPTPTPAGDSVASMSQRTASSSSAWKLFRSAGVRMLRDARMAPVSSTMPALMWAPPISMPRITIGSQLTLPHRPRRALPVRCMLAPMSTWDPALYQDKHAFVWQYGRDLIGLLAPRSGERILDVGCGPGQLTAQIAAAGAEVTGIDSSPAMIAEARKNYPELRFELTDAGRMAYDRQFHAVFSNAALHWVRDAEAAAAGMARALEPGGRLVVELGGKGNVQQLRDAISRALDRNLPPPDPGEPVVLSGDRRVRRHAGAPRPRRELRRAFRPSDAARGWPGGLDRHVRPALPRGREAGTA